MSKFNQILKQQQVGKKKVNSDLRDDVATVSMTEEILSPVQRRSANGAQYGIIFKRLNIDLIDVSPYQPRLTETLDQIELQNLADNIRQHGQINPIVVRPKNGRYELVGGERRLRAIRDLLKLKDIDCLVKDISDEKAALTALIDNINRADLSDYEIAHALSQTCQQFGYPLENVDFITEKFNISRNKYYRLISLFDLPDFMLQDLKIVPQALSGSGASLLKTAMNRAVAQVGLNKSIEILKQEWNIYLHKEYNQTHRRNTQFIKIFEQKIQHSFSANNEGIETSNSESAPDPSMKANAELQEMNNVVLLNRMGKKLGSMKYTQSTKGKTVVSMRMSFDHLTEEKISRLKEFLENLDAKN